MENKIINIGTFSSINNQKEFFLDTNVLYWYVYPRYGVTKKGVKHQAQPYYDFVDKLVSDGNPIFTSVYNISELLNVIEKNEFDIFKTLNPDTHYNIKDYRKDMQERKKLKKILQTTLNNIDNTCSVLDFSFTYCSLINFTKSFEQHRCDPFDFLILENCIKTSHTNIITDDNDFSAINGITLFTANETTLALLK